MATINNTNNIQSLDNHYLRADGVLEEKKTTLLGRFVQWVKIACNPKLYKADSVVKRHIFNISTGNNPASLQNRHVELLVSKLKGKNTSPEHAQSIKTYNLATRFFSSISRTSLENVKPTSDTSPYEKKMIIFKNGFKASGYTNNEFIEEVAGYLSGSDHIINRLDDLKEEEQLPYLLDLIEDFKQLHESIYKVNTSFPESLKFCDAWHELIDLCRCSSPNTGEKDPSKTVQFSLNSSNSQPTSRFNSWMPSWMGAASRPNRYND